MAAAGLHRSASKDDERTHVKIAALNEFMELLRGRERFG